jgi:ribonuclease P protein component
MTYEAHLSAQQPRAQAPSRLPQPLRDAGWPQGPRRAPRAWPQDTLGLSKTSIDTIGRRADFLAANGARRAAMPGFVLLVRQREDNNPVMRLGITVTKKIGNAVVRNRMKRRFRALAREVFPDAGFAGADHVLIGRAAGIERDFGDLKRELGKALGKVAR